MKPYWFRLRTKWYVRRMTRGKYSCRLVWQTPFLWRRVQGDAFFTDKKGVTQGVSFSANIEWGFPHPRDLAKLIVSPLFGGSTYGNT